MISTSIAAEGTAQPLEDIYLQPEPETFPPTLRSVSSFLHTPETIPYSSSPSIIHLKRDLLVPLSFQPPESPSSDGSHHDGRAPAYNSNGILNTRFGDFPHSSIVGIPYGSQVRAAPSAHNNRGRKRKRKDEENLSSTPTATPPAELASTGFLHVLAPTAELWTASLPHRTQVVYTPDSSYILHKLRVRPGSVLIEAGAGSGSFTHAGVRAVYNGYPDGRDGGEVGGKRGKVFSFEFHKERVEKLTDEIERHGLDGLVEIVHRDVCKDGFLLGEEGDGAEGEVKGVSPRATAIFLDLPAPWLALPHLTRCTQPTPSLPTSTGLTPSPSPGLTPKVEITEDPPATVNAPVPLQELLDPTSSASSPKAPISTLENGTTIATTSGRKPTSNDTFDLNKPSALSPDQTVRICTFSPCIEQVTRTVSVLRRLGWVDIEMAEVQHRRIEVRRQNTRGYEDGAGPRTVEEAIQRLKWVGEYREHKKERDKPESSSSATPAPPVEAWKSQNGGGGRDRKSAKDGRIVTRIEPEIKTHTSYLVFAVLPRGWTAEDEEAAAALVRETTKGVVNAPVDSDVKGNGKPKWKGIEEGVLSKRQIKRAEREKRKEEEREAKEEKGATEKDAVGEGVMEEGVTGAGAAEEDVGVVGDGVDEMEVDE